MHRADLVAEVPRGGLDARPLEFSETGDGPVGIVAGEQGLLGAALGVGARGGRGRRRRGEHRGGAERGDSWSDCSRLRDKVGGGGARRRGRRAVDTIPARAICIAADMS